MATIEEMLSDRVNRISLSPTLRVAATAQAMKAEGVDVVDLSIGEPDFPTPRNVKEAGKKAIDADFTKYTTNEGIPELRKAICRKLKADNGLEYEPHEVIVTCGAKASLYALSVAVLSEGEDVLIPAPYWVSYPDQVRLAKANPVFVPTLEENGFRVKPEDVRAALTFNTKAIILNTPNNPTGAALGVEDLQAIADIAVKEGLIIISDEIYEKLVYDGFRHVSIATLGPKVKAQSVVINGVSKSYSMTGWRIGYAAGPKEVIAAMSKVQSHSTSNPTSISQKAALEALSGPQGDLTRMASEFERRRNLMLYRLGAIPGVSCAKPKGAFYAFPNVSAYFEREFKGSSVRNSYGLAYYLLKEAKVAVVPGDAFGAPRFMRLSYATSEARIEEGVARMREALLRLETPKRGKPKALANTETKVKTYAPADVIAGVEMSRALRAEAEAHLRHDNYFEWNCSVAGVVLQLRTNSPHLSDFWADNFYPAPIETDLEPHCVIYAVKDVKGREPRAFYSPETRTGFVFNTAFYGQLRGLALGMAAEVTERTGGVHWVHAAAVDFGGCGILLFAPPATGKSAHLGGLLRGEGAKIVATDMICVRLAGGEVVADAPERKFYLKTDWVEAMPETARLLDGSKVENVVMKREDCVHPACPEAATCRIDRGKRWCYSASPDSRAMLDPYWIGGPERAGRRTAVRGCVLLRRDPVSPAVQKLAAEDAARLFEQGSAGGIGGARAVPFFNPHLLGRSGDRTDFQKQSFLRLFKAAPLHVVNIASGTKAAVQEKIAGIVAACLKGRG